LTIDEFEDKLKNGDFLEHSKVHRIHYYGLSKSLVFDTLSKGNHLIKDIDYIGLNNLKKILSKKNLISIFIMPPSIKRIKERIHERSDIGENELQERLASINIELEYSKNCDFIFTPIDGNIEESQKIFEKEFLKFL